MTREEWLRRRSYRGAEFDAERIAATLAAHGQSVSVCLPTLNVATTLGPILAALRERYVGDVPLIDELAIVDSRSSDATADIARELGARVIQDDEVLPELGPGRGKGEAMWKSVHALRGDIVVWIDSDIVDFDPAFLPGLVGPLAADPGIAYVKAFYRRSLGATDDDGGRVTEICARPLLNLFYPQLAGFVQPLSGEAAGRREVLRRVPFFGGYAVEIGLLIDLLAEVGLEGLAQVDLGHRAHVNQPTRELGAMAAGIVSAVLRRLHQEGRASEALAAPGEYAMPARREGALVLETREMAPGERPALERVAPPA